MSEARSGRLVEILGGRSESFRVFLELVGQDGSRRFSGRLCRPVNQCGEFAIIGSLLADQTRETPPFRISRLDLHASIVLAEFIFCFLASIQRVEPHAIREPDTSMLSGYEMILSDSGTLAYLPSFPYHRVPRAPAWPYTDRRFC